MHPARQAGQALRSLRIERAEAGDALGEWAAIKRLFGLPYIRGGPKCFTSGKGS